MNQEKDNELGFDANKEEVTQERIDDANAAIAELTEPEMREMTEEEFLSDPENIKGSLQLSAQFLGFMGDKWFTVEQLMRRSQMDRMQAVQKLQMIKKFGHAKVRMGSYQDKPKHFREPMWMIVISPALKLKAVDAVILDCQHQLEKLNLERKSLLLEIEKAQTVN